MEVRPILLKEIAVSISLSNLCKRLCLKDFRLEEGKSRNRFFLP